MPFLDHLEELRRRILWSLGSVVVGFGLGLFMVQRLDLLNYLKAPIEPYLPTGRLIVLSPTDPVMVVLKLAFVTGLVLASPIILWQLWAFLAPALYEREKKALVPTLFAGTGLFIAGAVGSWFLVVPRALAVLLSFQVEAIETFITFDKYFGFVLQIVLAMGISAELPLVLILLTALGITTPQALGRFRRVAVVLAFVAGALLSPGADAFSMMLMTIPLLLLYEVGVAGSVLVHRRRLKREAARTLVLLCLLGGVATPAAAQDPAPPPVDTLRPRPDTLQARRVDTATARRLGLPSGPTRSFPAADTLMARLLRRPGFLVTRYVSDTATVAGVDRQVRLSGNALAQRQQAILEADRISYAEADCALQASGDPRLFETGHVLVGGSVRYDACRQRGVVADALTTFQQGAGDWFLRGNLGVEQGDSLVGGRELFAASSDITSCDLPEPHYHFAAGEVKWMSSTLMVARPAVLYVRDVPIMWLPFIFQETKNDRRSGILVPQFGFNDIVRTNTGYDRQITDFGYYWAINDYLDAQIRFDWYSNRYYRYAVQGSYRWLNRFMNGTMGYSRQVENSGATSVGINWRHSQDFNITTRLAVNLNLNSNTRVVADNAIDPFLNTQQLSSDLNFTKRFQWGNLTVGATRRQTLGTDQLTQTLPAVTLTPSPVAFSRWGTWSPTVSVRNDLNVAPRQYLTFRTPTGVDSVENTPEARTLLVNFDTPLRLGSFNWRNSFVLRDVDSTGISGLTQRLPNDLTPDPTDSIDVVQTLAGSYQSELDWQTGINLPLLFRRTWKITPTLGVTNRTSGPFAVRNPRTDGEWVTQGKRFNFALSSAPTFFGFWPGFGPFQRIRHSFAPNFSWSWSPEATIPTEYAEATRRGSGPLQLTSPASQTLTVGLNQTFEAKERQAPGDSAGAQPRKLRLLSWSTSSVSYDFEQAKLDGRTGWITGTLSNQLQSDLLPGFRLDISHSLWDGPVGFEGTEFDPFLSSVSAGFTITSRTVQGAASLFGLGPERALPAGGPRAGVEDLSYGNDPRSGIQQRSLEAYNSIASARRAFAMNVNVTIQRNRPDAEGNALPGNSNVGLTTQFSPTSFWGVTWTTQYSVTRGTFEAQVLRLERDLHDWRAGFNFVRNPNGNFAFYFSIHLTDLPDLKMDYNQNTVSR